MGQFISRLQDVPDLAALTPSVGAMLFVSAYSGGTASWSYLADVAAGAVLVSGGVGVAPAWSTSPVLSGVLLQGGPDTIYNYLNFGGF